MAGMFESGQGSLPYNGQWNLFDQIILSPAFPQQGRRQRVLPHSSCIQTRIFVAANGDYKGTHGVPIGNNYHGGFSDHLPVFVIFRKN